MNAAEKIIPITTLTSYRCEMDLLVTMLGRPAKFAFAVSSGLTDKHFMDEGIRFIAGIAIDHFRQRGHADVTAVFSEVIERGAYNLAGGPNGAIGHISVEPANDLGFNDNLSRVLTSHRLRVFYNKLNMLRSRVFSDNGTSLREKEQHMYEGLNDMMLSVADENMTLQDATMFAEMVSIDYANALEGKKAIFQKSGIVSLDEAAGGLVPGRVTIIAGRPSHGKTSFACWLTILSSRLWRSRGDRGQTLYFSAEMPADKVGDRFLSMLSGVGSHEIARGSLRDDQKADAERAIKDLRDVVRVSVDAHSSPTTAHIMSRALALNAAEPVRLIIFDYLEYTGEKDRSKDLRLEKALLGCHEVAKRIGCPVLVLSQLNRDLEKRGDAARPQLSDIRYTGAGENIASMVVMVYHPWTHWKQRGIDADKAAYGEPDPEQYDVFIRKNTHGPVGAFQLRFRRETTSFIDPLADRDPTTLKAPF